MKPRHNRCPGCGGEKRREHARCVQCYRERGDRTQQLTRLLAERARKGLLMACRGCGTPYTLETIYVHPDNRAEVECRPCRAEAYRQWRQRRRVAALRALQAEVAA
jgi:hypothetical protein